VDDPQRTHHASVLVIGRVEDERSERRVRFAPRRGDALDHRPQQLGDPLAGLRRDPKDPRSIDAEDLLDLGCVAVGISGGQVDLVKGGDDLEVVVDRLVGVRERLCLDALACIDEQHRSLAGSERPRDLVAKVDVPRRVDQVQDVPFEVHPDVLGLDRDAPLSFEIHRVEVLRTHVARVDRARELEDPVRQRGLPMIHVADDREIPYLGRLDRSLDGTHGHERLPTCPSDSASSYRRRIPAPTWSSGRSARRLEGTLGEGDEMSPSPWRRQVVRIRTPVIGHALSGLLSLSGVAAHANAPMPAPGRPDRVAALVAGSHDIDQLPSNLLPALSQASGADAPAYYPITESGCTGVSKCAFGDLASHRTVVLFGDSHALMWLPALVPVARSQHFRLVLIWKAACPAADVAVWDSKTNTVFAACNKFRWASILAIRALGPALVLLASRTSRVLGPHKGPISDDVWRAGLERTIGLLSIHKTRVAI